MNSSTVFIVKQKWDEFSHYSRVKRVFFSEEGAWDYINGEKGKERYRECHWIVSDREITDYEPCLDENDIELIKLEAVQAFCEGMISQAVHPSRTSEWNPIKVLEDHWAWCEGEKIKIEEIKELKP